MNRYYVGAEDYPIGIYYGTSKEDAIESCRIDIRANPQAFKDKPNGPLVLFAAIYKGK